MWRILSKRGHSQDPLLQLLGYLKNRKNSHARDFRTMVRGRALREWKPKPVCIWSDITGQRLSVQELCVQLVLQAHQVELVPQLATSRWPRKVRDVNTGQRKEVGVTYWTCSVKQWWQPKTRIASLLKSLAKFMPDRSLAGSWECHSLILWRWHWTDCPVCLSNIGLCKSQIAGSDVWWF